MGTKLTQVARKTVLTTDQNCVFCKIISGQVAVQKDLENDQVIAFRDLTPVAEIHILVVPKKHIPNFMEITQAGTLGSLSLAIQQLVVKLNIAGAYKIVINGGSYQHVPHLHWHLLGGKLLSHP